MSLRWKLVTHLLASWVLALLALCLFALFQGNMSEGIWAVQLLALVSVPLVAIAAGVVLAAPRAIAARPLLWGSIAVAISVGCGFAVAAMAGLTFAASIAVPALLIFVGSIKVWPGLKVP